IYHGSSTPELRLVLLGNLGCGKTSSADTILGQLSRVSPAAARSCQQRQNIIEGRSVTLVEAPRWYWSGGRMEDSVRKETERAMTLVAPGPHAILLLVPVCQFTEVGFVSTVFGPEAVQRHALVLFTYADRLRRGDLLNLVEKCRDRFHVMESGGGETERRSVAELLEKVEQTVKEAGGQCYSSPAFQEAENRVRQRQVEIAREKRGTNQEQAKSRDVGGLSTERQLYPYMQPVAENPPAVSLRFPHETCTFNLCASGETEPLVFLCTLGCN
uniref:AIG1-type G domain-containing protein n=1 Tax=Scophthalmus maximus TaxID=52904 RepID=A0A8D3BW11_SCOMX